MLMSAHLDQSFGFFTELTRTQPNFHICLNGLRFVVAHFQSYERHFLPFFKKRKKEKKKRTKCRHLKRHLRKVCSYPFHGEENRFLARPTKTVQKKSVVCIIFFFFLPFGRLLVLSLPTFHIFDSIDSA